jgi:hypothetical protein
MSQLTFAGDLSSDGYILRLSDAQFKLKLFFSLVADYMELVSKWIKP